VWDTVELSVDKSSAQAAVTRGPECTKLRNLHCVESVARKRLLETVFPSLCVFSYL
jgi:hypothetical protein